MKTSSRPWARAAAALAVSLVAAHAHGQALPWCTPITFESGTAEGFATTGQWHVSTACGANAGAHTTPNVLYYGNDGQCNFNTGATNSGNADSPPIQIFPGSQLRFNHRQASEEGDPYDASIVEYSTDGGGSWNPLIAGDELPRDGQWRAVAKDFPSLSGAVTLRFRFDSVDDIDNDELGWMVDDIQVCRSPPVPVPTSQPWSLALLAAMLSFAALAASRFRRR